MSESTTPELYQTEITLRPEAPRLRIHHFFLWTLVAAVMLALTTQLQTEPINSAQLSIGLVWLSCHFVLWSVYFTVLLLGIRWRMAGLRFFDHVGHWIAVAEVSRIAFVFGIILLEVWGDDEYFTISFTFFLFLAYAVRSVIVFLMYFRIARSVADTGAWKSFCQIAAWLMPLTIVFILYFFGMHMGSTSTTAPPRSPFLSLLVPVGGALIYCLFLGLAVKKDIQQKRLRHWSHWVLVGVALLDTISFYSALIVYVL